MVSQSCDAKLCTNHVAALAVSGRGPGGLGAAWAAKGRITMIPQNNTPELDHTARGASRRGLVRVAVGAVDVGPSAVPKETENEKRLSRAPHRDDVSELDAESDVLAVEKEKRPSHSALDRERLALSQQAARQPQAFAVRAKWLTNDVLQL